MEKFKAELLNGIQEVISTLNENKNCNDLELCAMRLEVLAESALGNDVIPPEAVDPINKVVHLLRSCVNVVTRYDQYQAQLGNDEQKQGCPKYNITEDRLNFFQGKSDCLMNCNMGKVNNI